jgi:hypothetical protein
MPITIAGDMSPDEADRAMIEDLRALLASNAADNLIQISHRQAERFLEILDIAKPPG